MNLISVDKISITEGDKLLIQDASFGIDTGDKIAITGINGSGKSTLIKVLANLKPAGSGAISRNNDLKISYLHQDVQINENQTILEHILDSGGDILNCVREYYACLDSMAAGHNEDDNYSRLLTQMDNYNAWEIESRIKSILTELGITDLTKKMSELSGGMLKKTALAHALVQDYNLLFLDEPTNHLDIKTINWLQDYLMKSNKAVVLVTHDRYFLDNITTRIIEIDDQRLFFYNGNYSYFMDKKAERANAEAKSQEKLTNILRREVEWLRRGPKARTSKDRGRINRAYDMMDQVKSAEVSSMGFSVTNRRLGKKILVLKNISKTFGEQKILSPFTYTFKKGERIGIIGENGSGKTTFLNILTERTISDSGTVDKGINTVFGYFDQMGMKLPENMGVLEYLKDIASVIVLEDGRRITPSQFLEMFLFPKSHWYTEIGDLSGGEKRRLYLISILLKNPNFLILDEPTNDFDIQTLSLMEDFLKDFQGCLIVVSHDRYFLDRTVDFLFLLDGNGHISGFTGNYSDYQEYQKELEREAKKAKPKAVKAVNREDKKGLSFKEQREFESLEGEIEELESRTAELEESFCQTNLDPEVVQKNHIEYARISSELEEKMLRWEELAEKA